MKTTPNADAAGLASAIHEVGMIPRFLADMSAAADEDNQYEFGFALQSALEAATVALRYLERVKAMDDHKLAPSGLPLPLYARTKKAHREAGQ